MEGIKVDKTLNIVLAFFEHVDDIAKEKAPKFYRDYINNGITLQEEILNEVWGASLYACANDLEDESFEDLPLGDLLILFDLVTHYYNSTETKLRPFIEVIFKIHHEIQKIIQE